MTDVKCIRCGALSLATSQICKICEIELNPIRPPSAASIFLRPHQPSASSINTNTTPLIGPFDGVGDVLSPTLILFTKNFWLITKLTIVIFAPLEIFQALSIADIPYDWQLAAGLGVLKLLCSVLVAPALICALMQVMQTGIAPGVNEAYRRGFSTLGKLIVCAAIGWIFTWVGFMLCIVPGIIVGVSLSLIFPIAVLEKGSVTEILHSSLELTRGHRWKILGAYIVIVILSLLFTVPADMIGAYLGYRAFSFWPIHAAAKIFGDIVHQSSIVLSLVTYLSIRAYWFTLNNA